MRERSTKRDITGDGLKDLAIAILQRARMDLEGSYVIIKGQNHDEIIQAAKEDALAWFQKSEQCDDFLEWLNIKTDLTYLIESSAFD